MKGSTVGRSKHHRPGVDHPQRKYLHQRDRYEPPQPDDYAPIVPHSFEHQAWYQSAPPDPPAALMTVGWTISTYALHMEAMRAADMRFGIERDRRYAEVNVEKEKALKIKETADLAALGLAREIQTYKDEKANELREQISNERGLYATKSDLQAAVEKLEATIKPIAEYVSVDRGRSRVSDPAAAALSATVERLEKGQQLSTGQRAGALDQRQLLTWGLGVLLALLSVYTFTQARGTAAPSQVIVVPAGTTTPSAVQSGPSTQAVPR